MIKTLDRFELVEQIDTGGFTTVYRAVEHMGQGITRPAAVKVMPTLGQDDDEQLERLRREVEVLIEFGGAPNIVSILAIGIDEEMGAWIAMELAGKSLKHFIGDKPAEPDQARVLLRDTLRALTTVHGAESLILHRDIKPQNILSAQGLWKVSDFGLAKRHGADDTMALATVKYAAPELLDSTLGEESARIDLYSLGLVVYEYALGHELFRKQFPSIYDSSGGSEEVDQRPQWMYWHTSQQMTLPPLEELIEGYPKDLSDLVASMTAKPVEQRVASADEALRRLGEVGPSVPLNEHVEEESKAARGERASISPKLAVVATCVILVAMVGATMWYLLTGRTSVEFDANLPTEVASQEYHLAGTVKNYDAGGKLEIKLKGNSKPVHFTVSPQGRFTSEVQLASLGPHTVVVSVKDGSGKQVALGTLDINRARPDRVQVVLSTKPMPVAGVTVKVRGSGDEASLETVTTDSNGRATVEVPYGEFSLEAIHARYFPVPTEVRETGLNAVAQQDIVLAPRDYGALQAEMRVEMDRLESLMKLKVNCPPGPLTPMQEQEVVASTAKLRELAGGDLGLEMWLATLAEVKDCDPASMVSAPPEPPPPGALDGEFADPAVAQNRLMKGIDELLKAKTECPPGPLSATAEELLANSIDELESLALGEIVILAYVESARQARECDPSSRPTDVPHMETLAERSDPAVAINRLRDRIVELLKVKTECPPGPLSPLQEEELMSTLTDLSVLVQGDIEFGLFIDNAQRAEDCDPSSMPEDIPHRETIAEREKVLRGLFPGLSPEEISEMARPGGVGSQGRMKTLAEREADLRQRYPGASPEEIRRMAQAEQAVDIASRGKSLAEREAALRQLYPDRSPAEIREMAQAQMAAEGSGRKTLAEREAELRQRYPGASAQEIRRMAEAQIAAEGGSGGGMKTLAEREAELRQRYPDATPEEIRRMAKAEQAVALASRGKSLAEREEALRKLYPDRNAEEIRRMAKAQMEEEGAEPGMKSLAEREAELRRRYPGASEEEIRRMAKAEMAAEAAGYGPGSQVASVNPEIAKAMNTLVKRIEGLIDTKVNCPPGPLSPFEESTLASATSELKVLAQGDVDTLLYLDRVKLTKDCDPASRPANVPSKNPTVDQSDPAVIINMLQARIEGLLDRKVTCPPGPLSPFEEKALSEAIDDLASIAMDDVDIQIYLDRAGRVKDCDPASRPPKLPRKETRAEQEARVAAAYGAAGSGAGGVGRTLAEREEALRQLFPNKNPAEIRQMAEAQIAAEARESAGAEAGFSKPGSGPGSSGRYSPGSTSQGSGMKTIEEREAELRQRYPNATPEEIRRMAEAEEAVALASRGKSLEEREEALRQLYPDRSSAEIREMALAQAADEAGSQGGINTLAEREAALSMLYPNKSPDEIRQMAREEALAEREEALRKIFPGKNSAEIRAMAVAQIDSEVQQQSQLARTTSDPTWGRGGGASPGSSIPPGSNPSRSAIDSLMGDIAAATGVPSRAGGGAQATSRTTGMGRSLGAGGSGGKGSVDSVIAETLAGLPANEMLVNKMMALPLDQFVAFVRMEAPLGTVDVEPLPDFDQVRIRGQVFSNKELTRLITRLAYGIDRIQIELEVDPWGVVRKVHRGLEALGADGVQVDAYLVPNDQTLFVQFRKGTGVEVVEAEIFSRSFVVDPGLLWVAEYLGTSTAPAEEAEAETESL